MQIQFLEDLDVGRAGAGTHAGDHQTTEKDAVDTREQGRALVTHLHHHRIVGILCVDPTYVDSILEYA